jgi:hypothetical protein
MQIQHRVARRCAGSDAVSAGAREKDFLLEIE